MSNSSSADLNEKIRIKAYLLWEKAGCPDGDGHPFWVEAEKVITRMAKLNEAKKAKAAAKPVVKAAAKAKAKPVADPVVVAAEKPEKKKKKKKEKSEKKKSDKKKEKK